MFFETSLVEVTLWFVVIFWNCLFNVEWSFSGMRSLEAHEVSCVALELAALTLNFVNILAVEISVIFLECTS